MIPCYSALINDCSFCLMRGFFDPVDSLLDLVDEYCALNREDCELFLFDSYWIRGGNQLQLNDFKGGVLSFEQAYQVLQQATAKGLIDLHDDRYPIAFGLMGNGRMAMNDFDGAEKWYLKAFQMWEKMDEDVFQDKQLFVSVPKLIPISVANPWIDLKYGCLPYFPVQVSRS